MNIFQIFTLLKCSLFDTGNTLRNCDVPQTGTPGECLSSNRGNTFRNCDICRTEATVKGPMVK